MAHVGYVYAYLPQPVLKLLDRQRVVEVLGVLRVDGAGEGVAEVLAFGIVFGRYLSRNLLGSLLHVLRILIRQAVLCKDSVHLDVVVASLAQHVHHFAYHISMVLVGPFHDVNDSVVAVLATLQLASRNDDAVGKYVGWRDEGAQVVVERQSSDERILCTLEYFDNLRLLDMVLASCHTCESHAVAGQSPHRVALSHKDRFVRIVGHYAVLAVGLTLEHTLLHLTLHVELVGVVAHLGDEVVPRHLLHYVDGEHLERMGVKMQGAENLLERHCLAGIGGEEFLKFRCKLFLCHALAAFFTFSHSRILF